MYKDRLIFSFIKNLQEIKLAKMSCFAFIIVAHAVRILQSQISTSRKIDEVKK